MFDLVQITRAPRRALDHLASTTWRALAAGSIDEEEAAALSEAIEARRHALRAAGKPAGAFPVSAMARWPSRAPRPSLASPKRRERLERRRRLAASAPMPPALAAMFTVSELAVLRIVGDEVRDRGVCDRTLDELASRAGCCRTTARNAIRAARGHGLVDIEERRVPGRRSLPNLVRVTSPEWLAWLRRGPRREADDRVQKVGALTDTDVPKRLRKPSRGRSVGSGRRSTTATTALPRPPWRRPRDD